MAVSQGRDGKSKGPVHVWTIIYLNLLQDSVSCYGKILQRKQQLLLFLTFLHIFRTSVTVKQFNMADRLRFIWLKGELLVRQQL